MPYAQEPATANTRRAKVSVHAGLAVLLAAALLVAVNSRTGTAPNRPRVLVPGSSPTCTSPPTGFLFSRVVDGVRMDVCISEEGNINQISYPDTGAGHTQLAFDGYCVFDVDTNTHYTDYSPGAPTSSTGFGRATFSAGAVADTWNMTRTTTDGKYQLSEFIKISFAPRSIFVGMTIKNVDPANVTHTVSAYRDVAPALDGSASDDQYDEYGGMNGVGHTGQAFQAPAIGTNSMLFGLTQVGGSVLTQPVANFQLAGGCGGFNDPPGHVTGGNRVFSGHLDGLTPALARNQSASVGKFVYRML